MRSTSIKSSDANRSDVITVGLIGPDTSGGAPGGMASISRGLVEGFSADGMVTVVPISNFVEGSFSARLGAALGSLRSVLRMRHQLDLVHIQVATGWSVERDLVTVVTARAVKIPVVLQFHGADQEGDYARSHRLQKFLYRRLFSASRTNLALGNGAAAWLREICPHVPVRVVPNFVETRDVARVANDDVARFAFVGRVGSRKGIYDLLDAVCMFVDEGGHLQVEVLGDGEVEEVRRRVAGDERLRSRVRVHGWCGADEVASVLDECWSLVLPSYAEGLPMAALEAMANGRAVIATRVGEIEDAVADGQSGILIEPGDVHALAKAMQFISSDLERALEFGRCGRQIIARDFSRARVIGLLEDVYRTAANHRPSVSA